MSPSLKACSSHHMALDTALTEAQGPAVHCCDATRCAAAVQRFVMLWNHCTECYPAEHLDLLRCY